MLINQILKLKSTQNSQGFTILEVVVAGLVSFGFLLVTLQAMVYSTYSRVRAQEKSDADTWIREDSDFIKYLASDPCLTDSGSDGYANDLKTELADYRSGQANHDPALEEYAHDPSATYDSSTKYLNNDSSAGRTYELQRTLTANGDTLQLTYAVKHNQSHLACDVTNNTTWDNCVTTVYMEVIPDAANANNDTTSCP